MNVFVTAGGTGIDTSNTIERKIDKNILLKYVTEDIPYKLIKKDNSVEYSIWGLSDKGTVSPNNIKHGDRVFITKLSCVVYVGEVLTWFTSDGLNDEIWFGQKGWEHKIILKNVTKVFIPDEEFDKERNMKRHYSNHQILETEKQNFSKVEKLYLNKKGFRYIFGITNKGNIQGNRQLDDPQSVLKRFDEYCLETAYQCIVKKV